MPHMSADDSPHRLRASGGGNRIVDFPAQDIIMPKSLKKPVVRRADKINKISVAAKASARSRTAPPPSTLTPVPANKPDQPNTKSCIIPGLLGRRTGATIRELAATAQWQEHSVRGFLSGTLKKKRSLSIMQTIVDGVRRYHIEQLIGDQ